MSARVERARQLMHANRLQAIVVTNGSSLTYYSGLHWWISERFFGMVLPAKGDPFFVCPAFEEDRAREQLAEGPFGAKRGRPHLAGGRKSLRPSRAGHGRSWAAYRQSLGIEEKTPFVFSNEYCQA